MQRSTVQVNLSFQHQESFIKSELQKVDTGLQSTEVDGTNIYYLHSASLNLLTKAEQILTYYLNEKGYEVSSSLGQYNCPASQINRFVTMV